MKVIVTGATGLVGRALIRSLLSEGHNVTRLVRGGAQAFSAPGTRAVHWEPEKGSIDAKELEGHDAAVHLAGESIADGRWSDEKKKRIRESRVVGTRLAVLRLRLFRRRFRNVLRGKIDLGQQRLHGRRDRLAQRQQREQQQ